MHVSFQSPRRVSLLLRVLLSDQSTFLLPMKAKSNALCKKVDFGIDCTGGSPSTPIEGPELQFLSDSNGTHA